MDGVVSPATAIEIGRLGGAGVLNLEGLWTRYDDPDPLLEEIALLDAEKATRRMQDIYLAPIQPELVTERIRQIRDAGLISVASVTPQRTDQLLPAIRAGELDMLVIQGTVVSAEHVSKNREPLNLLKVIREMEIPVIVGGCASYQAALHLMRTGACGVLVGVGPGHACTTRGCSASACPRPPPSPTPGPPGCATSTRPASTSTSSPTVAWAPAATSPRPSSAAPTPS